MSQALIRIEGMDFEYDPGQVLLHVNRFEIDESDFVVVIGPNGSGKSTLCKLLVGVLSPKREPKEFFLPDPPPVLVWQEQELFPLTVKKNLTIVCQEEETAERLLQDFGLQNERKCHAWALSGGQKERLAIARALAARQRKAFIFDEPTQSIDPSFVDDIAEEILKIKQQRERNAVVVVTHDDRLVSLLARENPRIYVLEPVRRTTRLINSSELKGPYVLKQLYESPPTRYAAEFARYENIYELANPQREKNVRNLYPLGDDDPSSASQLIVVRDEAIAVTQTPVNDSVGVERVSVEFRSGGRQVVRYRWRLGCGMKPLDFILPIESAPPGLTFGYLRVEGSRCLVIQRIPK